MNIKKITFFLIFFLFSFQANARITIFACEVEWEYLVKEIARDVVDIEVALHPLQHPDSYVNLSKSLIQKMARADLVICSGAGIEDKWLPKLLKKSPKKSIRSGENVMYISNHIRTANPSAQKSIARFHLNPYNIVKIADEIARLLRQTDPENSISYQKNLENFNNRWFAAVKRWQKRILPVKDMSVIVKDDSWNHMSRWLDLRIIGKIEHVNQVRPTRKELKELERLIKERNVKAIIVGNNQNKEDVFYLSKKTGVRVISLPFTIKALSGINDLFDLFDYIILRSTLGCKNGSCRS